MPNEMTAKKLQADIVELLTCPKTSGEANGRLTSAGLDPLGIAWDFDWWTKQYACRIAKEKGWEE